MKRTLFVTVIVVMMLVGCSDNSTAPFVDNTDYTETDMLAESVSNELINANLAFAINAFKEIVGQDSDENIFISPISLSVALTMCCSGAAGNTREAMADVLGYEDMDFEDVKENYKNLIASLENCDARIDLSLANSMWIDNTLSVKDGFINTNVEYFDANVSNMNLHTNAAPETINNWVSSNTGGHITDLIDYISPEELLLLINAIYFKGTWKFQFDASNTMQSDFYLQDGTTKTVNMMVGAGNDFTYCDGEHFQAVRMPYKRDKVAMYLFLPYIDSDIDYFIDNMDTDYWNYWFTSFDSLCVPIDDGYFQIPKFKMEYEVGLNEILCQMGMSVAFGGFADFSGISDEPLWITKVKQKAFIEVNEAGSEAAAATVVVQGNGMPPSFIANRPFFFVIRDDRTQTILFMGKMLEPEDD